MSRVDLKTLDREECRSTFDTFWEVRVARGGVGWVWLAACCAGLSAGRWHTPGGAFEARVSCGQVHCGCVCSWLVAHHLSARRWPLLTNLRGVVPAHHLHARSVSCLAFRKRPTMSLSSAGMHARPP